MTVCLKDVAFRLSSLLHNTSHQISAEQYRWGTSVFFIQGLQQFFKFFLQKSAELPLPGKRSHLQTKRTDSFHPVRPVLRTMLQCSHGVLLAGGNTGTGSTSQEFMLQSLNSYSFVLSPISQVLKQRTCSQTKYVR